MVVGHEDFRIWRSLAEKNVDEGAQRIAQQRQKEIQGW
jgi:hypothetical protein